MHICALFVKEEDDRVARSIAHLLAAGAATNALNDVGMTPLHSAAVVGNCTIMRQLLEHNPTDANVRDSKDATPLSYASRYIKVVRLLIEFGADVNARDVHDKTPVIVAARNWQPDERLDVVRTLLDAGADVKAAAKDGLTVLHLHFRKRSKRLVEMLIARGADVNANSTKGTPLHRAARGNSVKCIRLLLEHGADVSARCLKRNWTVLHYAMQRHKPRKVVQMLVDAGVDVNGAGNKGTTPLHVLLRRYPKTRPALGDMLHMTLDTARLLVANGADVNAVRSDGATPLFVAYETALHEIFPRYSTQPSDWMQNFYDAKVRKRSYLLR